MLEVSGGKIRREDLTARVVSGRHTPAMKALLGNRSADSLGLGVVSTASVL